jgi:hypothetical protein
MAKQPLEQRLKGALAFDATPPAAYAEMVARLRAIAEILEKEIDAGRNVAQVTLEPGHLVDAGLQYNAVVHLSRRNRFRDTLFRAYVPASGEPVTLDLTGDRPTLVRSPDELEDRVVDFLSRPEIRGMLRELRELA